MRLFVRFLVVSFLGLCGGVAAGEGLAVRFVVAGPAVGSAPNVTVLAFTPAGLRSGVAAAVEAGVHAAGG